MTDLPSLIQGILEILENQQVEITHYNPPMFRILGIATTAEKIMEAVGAAASVRAEAGTEGMEIIELVAKIPLWRDTFPDAHRDQLAAGAMWEAEMRGLTPDHVRQARAIVAAAERKEVMPPERTRLPDTRQSDTAPPTAGPIPEAGAPLIGYGDESWTYGAPSPQPPAPAEGAPDVAWLVKIILASLYIGTDGASIFGAHKAARVIFTAQAAALAAKEVEIERLRSDAPGTPNARLKWIGDWAVSHGLCLGVEAQAPEKFVIEHIAALEAALQKIIDLQDRSFVGGESLIMRAITIARAALSGKEPTR